ncbi:MAG: Preprotein translocase subunit YajC [Ignavibacteriae bacterium]|nr:MAG: Preprotein translocase subunit YajC [Ignavibacteriota bacterium]
MEILNLIAMAPQGQGSGGGIASTLIMFAAIIAIFYFMIIRPQQKRQKERQKMLDSIQKGDKVITIGGVHGTVVGMDEKTVLIQIADNVKVKFEKSAISTKAGQTETDAPKLGE